MKKTRLKGGSLSGTYLCEPPAGALFVRKEVSLSKNREYGFQRWYSQLKRMQRYSVMFPGIFPTLIDYGCDEDMAFFDMEFIADALTVHQFLLKTTDHEEVDRMFTELQKVMARMHSTTLASSVGSMDLYIAEEVEQKLRACAGNQRFREFSAHTNIIFNGTRVPSLSVSLERFKALAKTSFKNPVETFTHGNLTLENILYQPATGKIIFIDPYEENIIDSILAEYSQIYQSCRSKYELYNAASVNISGNEVVCVLPPSEGLEYFEKRFTEFLQLRHSYDDLCMIRLFEVSQYARMLPFKMNVDEDKMILFFALGSYLLHKLIEDIDSEG